MSKTPENQHNSLEIDEETNEIEYEDMDLLERLETLREDMEDLKITTLAEIIQRIADLHQTLDQKQ